MQRLTALIHTHNDGLRLGRCLETLRPCDETLVIDHHSSDATIRIARQYGAKIIPAAPEVILYTQHATHDWILCLDACESITEHLEASLLEWKVALSPSSALAYSLAVREESASGWHEHTSPTTRLISKPWSRWKDSLPAYDPSLPVLEGELLRFRMP